MNLRELARLANVSVSTVSKAFNNAPDISEETRELVFAAAKKYGCYEKYHKEKYSKKSSPSSVRSCGAITTRIP